MRIKSNFEDLTLCLYIHPIAPLPEIYFSAKSPHPKHSLPLFPETFFQLLLAQRWYCTYRAISCICHFLRVASYNQYPVLTKLLHKHFAIGGQPFVIVLSCTSSKAQDLDLD